MAGSRQPTVVIFDDKTRARHAQRPDNGPITRFINSRVDEHRRTIPPASALAIRESDYSPFVHDRRNADNFRSKHDRCEDAAARWTREHAPFNVPIVIVKLTSLLSLGASAFLIAGCTTIKAPNLTVQDGAVTAQSSEALVVDFNLHLGNPNNESLELLEIDYVMFVDGRHVFKGRRDAQATLPAGGEWTVRIPAVIPFDDAGWTETEIPSQVRYDVSGTLVYSSPGPLAEILLDARIWRPKAGFHAKGNMTLHKNDAVSSVTVEPQ